MFDNFDIPTIFPNSKIDAITFLYMQNHEFPNSSPTALANEFQKIYRDLCVYYGTNKLPLEGHPKDRLTFPCTKVEALTMLYLQKLNLSQLSLEELVQNYESTYIELCKHYGILDPNYREVVSAAFEKLRSR